MKEKPESIEATNAIWLCEWQTISSRIESIDARLWEGAGILLVISLGGISLIGWHTPEDLEALLFIVLVGIVSIGILCVWWFLFHRWVHLQRIYAHRAREIEAKLNMWFNRYARLVEYWIDESQDLDHLELKTEDPEAFTRLHNFVQQHRNRRFVHFRIQGCLRALAVILTAAWLLLIVLHCVTYFLL